MEVDVMTNKNEVLRELEEIHRKVVQRKKLIKERDEALELLQTQVHET